MLVAGAEMLVRGGGQFALQLRVPALVVGLTIVAFGTSAPELVVSVTAALQGTTDMALSNINGSNIANILLVLGLSGLVAVVPVDSSLLQRDIPVAIFLQALLPVLALDGLIGRFDGGVMLLCALLYNVWLFVSVLRGRAPVDDELEVDPSSAWWKNLLMLLGGLVVLLVGAQLFVGGATQLAQLFGLSDRFIGLTVVAVGTSAPEIATSVLSARRGESALAVGNSLGSNILNIAMVLGITALIQPIPCSDPGFMGDMLSALAVSVMLVPLAMYGRIGRVEGGLMCLAYGGYIAWGLLA